MMEREAGAPKLPGRRWLWAAAVGTVLVGLGSVLIVGIHAQTRSHIREILELTQGQIRTDQQLQALNEVMTRGLMLSIGGFGAIVVGFLIGVLGLAGFLMIRKRHWAKNLRGDGGAR